MFLVPNAFLYTPVYSTTNVENIRKQNRILPKRTACVEIRIGTHANQCYQFLAAALRPQVRKTVQLEPKELYGSVGKEKRRLDLAQVPSFRG